jgi:twitching motility protein PilT
MDPDNDLDKLAAALAPRAVPAASSLRSWLEIMADRDASDLLLIAGEPPALRVNGRIVRTSGAVLDGDDVLLMVSPELSPHAQALFRDRGISDGSLKVPGLGRFRVNLHLERGRPAAVVRRLPPKVPSLASLNLPHGVEALSRMTRGLVIAGGATGSGKTTTVAALVDEINRRDEKHIITIEDPPSTNTRIRKA